ncbi:MCE family protein [Rhodococcus sp. USK10]|uniref:MlaD family protein n=1 Tax=Rhodococcus sp. USK10 TaxID=2789739 RepID=UPI001C5FF2EE|nr:MlaD family protein [Rhodococcus sp. USK10]QYB06116.1 MCE family protein [Rhodococcus sp. USK10]
MSGKSRLIVKVLAVVCAAAAVCGAGVAVATTGEPADRSAFCALMPDAIGLYAGNPVTQMGYEVGRVEAIEPQGDHVQVTFSLASGRSYPFDVRAVTRSKSLLADRSLELVGNYTTGPELAPQQCIPLEHSHTPKSISEIAGSAADFIDAIAPDDGEENVRKTVLGLDEALRGQGENAADMMRHAAEAAADPDKLVADIGSSIANMAPLTDEALRRWSSIRSIVEQMPAVVAAGIDLWPGVIEVCEGIGWLVATLHDIQQNYGADIWPFVHGPATDALRLAATRSNDIASLISTIPSVAPFLAQQTTRDGALTIAYQQPTVALTTAGTEVPMDRLLDLVRTGRN